MGIVYSRTSLVGIRASVPTTIRWSNYTTLFFSQKHRPGNRMFTKTIDRKYLCTILITYFGSGYFSCGHLIKHCIPPLLRATSEPVSGPISGPIVAHYLFPFTIIWFCILLTSSVQNLYRNLNTVWFPVQFQNQITSSQRILNIFQLILMDDSLNMGSLLSE
jgi:hypothetical protein